MKGLAWDNTIGTLSFPEACIAPSSIMKANHLGEFPGQFKIVFVLFYYFFFLTALFNRFLSPRFSTGLIHHTGVNANPAHSE